MLKTSERLLSLLSMLQAHRDWPGALLAERLDVSARTVRRDVDRLRGLGYSIAAIKGPDGGYRLDAGTALPPLLFDDDQAVALAVALQIATNSGAGIEVAAARALNTVRQLMPSRLRHRIDTVDVTAIQRPSIGPDAHLASSVLTSLSSAIHAREVLRFDYASPTRTDSDPQTVSPRRAEPHRLVTWGGRWYLVAWDLDRNDWRTLRADRITPRSPNGPRFAPRELPGGDVSTFVTSRFRGSSGSDEWPCRGQVILDIRAAEASTYSSDAIVEPIGPDRCRVTQGSWSWIGLAASIGRFDANIEVIGPPELKRAFAQLAHRYEAASTQSGEKRQKGQPAT